MRRICRIMPVLLLLSMAVRAESVSVSPGVLQQLNTVQQAMEKDEHVRAEQLLTALEKRKPGASAMAYVWQFRGNLALRQQREAAALDAFGHAHALNALPAEDQRKLLHSVAQLRLSQGLWREGTVALEQWIQEMTAAGAALNIRAEDYVLLAQGHSQQGRWHQVVKPVKTAIRLKGDAPEDWYRLQLAAHFKLEQWRSAADILKWLVERYPHQQQYWEQLASVYQISDRHDEALAVLRAAWVGEHFNSERQYLWLSQLMLQKGLPQRAAEILNEAMLRQKISRTLKHERLLAQAQLQAKMYDAGRATLQRIAQRQSDFDVWRQLAYLNMQLKYWDDMRHSIERAVALKPDAAELYLLSGIAEVNRNQWEQARSRFVQACDHDATREQALSWLNYLDQVQARS